VGCEAVRESFASHNIAGQQPKQQQKQHIVHLS